MSMPNNGPLLRYKDIGGVEHIIFSHDLYEDPRRTKRRMFEAVESMITRGKMNRDEREELRAWLLDARIRLTVLLQEVNVHEPQLALADTLDFLVEVSSRLRKRLRPSREPASALAV